MTETNCIVCGAPGSRPFFSLERVPVHCNVQYQSREAACAAPLADVDLALCPHCGHVFNRSFDPSRVEYDARYENSLHFSPLFDAYAREVAAALVEKYDLRDKLILEIGSGKGEFLRLICELGGNRGIGIDPSYRPDPADLADERIQFVSAFHSGREGVRADCVICRHVLEHLAAPLQMLTEVRQTVGDRADGPVVFFEVPNVLFTLRDGGIWDLIYEHVSYFSEGSLRRAFELAGFRVLETRETYGGQFLQIQARASVLPASSSSAVGAELTGSMAETFEERFQQKFAQWGQRLRKLRSDGRRVVLWGAGSKGVTFLNAFRDSCPVEYAVDLNPRKQGLFLPGTGQQIVGPDLLADLKPDLVLVANPLYLNEIQELVRDQHLSPEFAVL